MNNLKWADVAHMYSDIDIVDLDGEKMRNASFDRGGKCLAIPYVKVEGMPLKRLRQVNEYLPILRHLEDMTEDEARDFDFYRSGYPWKEDDGSCAAFVKYQYRVYRDGVIKSYGSPIALHWLYKNGFDLHRLIESGEAIRKPKA